MAEWITQIDRWIGYALSIISIVSCIIATIKAIKEKKFTKIKDYAITAIQEAERLLAKDGTTPISGEAKKEIVLAKIQTICNNLGYKYNEDEWSAIIETYVELTLKVNQREKDANRLQAAMEEKAEQAAKAVPVEQKTNSVSF